MSNKCNNGDFDYYIILEFMNWEETCGERNNNMKYHVDLSCVAPSQVGVDAFARAADCCGMDPASDWEEVQKVEMLHSYGIMAHLWQANGNNIKKLLQAAKKEAQLCEMLFGFYMDKAQNRCGSTGWEFLRNDINSGIARTMLSGTPTGNVLAAMHGISEADLETARKDSNEKLSTP